MVQPEVRGRDGIRLIHDQLAPYVESRRGPGEGERDEETHAPEHGTLDGAMARPGSFAVERVATLSDAPSRLEQPAYR